MSAPTPNTEAAPGTLPIQNAQHIIDVDKLTKATAVVEAADRLRPTAAYWSKDFAELREALANYHAGPAETETPGGGT